MRVIVAPDSFKGSLTAAQAAAAMARGVRRGWPGAAVIEAPVADGGEGLSEVLVQALGGTWVECRAQGPLGDPVIARYALLPSVAAGQHADAGPLAVIEVAAASGLTLVPPARRDALGASTYGAGQLVRDALDRGCRRFLIGLGGSATTDGGSGFAVALGARFLDAGGRPIALGGGSLHALARVDLSGLDPRVAASRWTAACDVDNPLHGPRGAAAVFGPQKGATPAQVAELDANLARLARILERDAGLPPDLAQRPGAGAAGGMGFALLAFCRAELRPGIELVLDACRFEERLAGTDLVLTGEGRIDGQTAGGKAPLGVARAARRHGVPVIGLAGSLGPGAEALLEHGFTALVPVVPGPCDFDTALEHAAQWLEDAAARALQLVRLGAAYGARSGGGQSDTPRPQP